MPNKGYKQTPEHKAKCKKNAILGSKMKIRKRWRYADGYKEVYHPSHNRKNNYIREHTLVMEKHLGREIKYPENIHHIDGDKLNNKLENLYLLSNISEHSKIHKQMERLVLEMYKYGFVGFVDGEYRLKEEAVAKLWMLKKGRDILKDIKI